tara:strand:- start:8245 stop:8733 length:489 start_codon:yes stop_codon:yes gene_type:complete
MAKKGFTKTHGIVLGTTLGAIALVAGVKEIYEWMKPTPEHYSQTIDGQKITYDMNGSAATMIFNKGEEKGRITCEDTDLDEKIDTIITTMMVQGKYTFKEPVNTTYKKTNKDHQPLFAEMQPKYSKSLKTLRDAYTKKQEEERKKTEEETKKSVKKALEFIK